MKNWFQFLFCLPCQEGERVVQVSYFSQCFSAHWYSESRDQSPSVDYLYKHMSDLDISITKMCWARCWITRLFVAGHCRCLVSRPVPRDCTWPGSTRSQRTCLPSCCFGAIRPASSPTTPSTQHAPGAKQLKLQLTLNKLVA